MSKTTTLKCDCGCDNTVEDPYDCGWLVLSQLPVDQDGSDPKLGRELQFSSFECLEKWTKKAISVIPGLQAGADGLRPRGTFSNKNVEGLYV